MFGGPQPIIVSPTQGYFSLENTTFTVPDGVYSICAAAQQTDGAASAVTLVIDGVTVLRAQNGNRIGDGGGDGGTGTTGSGGGGAGGYAGNGGNGGLIYYDGLNTSGTNGGAGSGGSGGGGGGGGIKKGEYPAPDSIYPSQSGGGVGISGIGLSGSAGVGANGVSGTPASAGGSGSADAELGLSGAGGAGVFGGALAWKNNIPVTPGQTITVNAAGGRVKLVWGAGMSYPNNAASVYSKNYSYKYWRIFITAGGANSFHYIREIEFRGSVGGDDLTYAGIPTVGSQSPAPPSGQASAFDNDPATSYVVSGVVNNAYIGCIFPTYQKIAQVSVRIMVGAGVRTISAFSVQVSGDGRLWGTVASFSGLTFVNDVPQLFTL